MKYSVLLMYPGLTAQGEPETYYGWATGSSPEEAEQQIRGRASKANDSLIAPGDFHLLAIFKGYREMERRNFNQP